MPKKPRKTRIGSRAWAAQKAHDIAHNQATKEQEKEKEKARGNGKRTQRDDQWKKERKEQKQGHEQEQKSESQDRQSWRQQTGTGSRHDPKRLACLRVLGLTPDKDNEESIKHEYRRLSLLFHPDRNPLVSALEKMKAINNAFEYLMGKNV